jgi:hypothetical protein
MTRILRASALLVLCALLGASLISTPALAEHNESDHSTNVKLLVNRSLALGEGLVGEGSDLAFQGNLLVAGTYQGTAFYRITGKRNGYLKKVGIHACPGSQGDISVIGKYVYVSVDSATTNNGSGPTCNNTDESTGLEGIRIVDISDLRQPKQVKFIETPCGSHTHTLVPDGATTYIYVLSYPLGAPSETCNQVPPPGPGHYKISIIKFPTNDPSKAELVDPFNVAPSIGCHDVTVYPERDIAVAGCISESQVWDITDPGAPVKLSTITNPDINIHHSSSFTWDGKYIILSDEYGGASAPGGCPGQQDSTVGAMWFYNITDPTAPVLEGHFALPRTPTAPEEEICTTHLYNILPMRDPNKYIAVASYYGGGMSVVDFSDPAAPVELGHYLPRLGGTLPNMWAAYWYNGRVYANNHGGGQGVEAFSVKGLNHDKVWFYKGRMNPQIQIESFK